VSILLVGAAVFVVGRGFVEAGAAHAVAVVGAYPQFSRAMLAQRWQSTSIVLGKGKRRTLGFEATGTTKPAAAGVVGVGIEIIVVLDPVLVAVLVAVVVVDTLLVDTLLVVDLGVVFGETLVGGNGGLLVAAKVDAGAGIGIIIVSILGATATVGSQSFGKQLAEEITKGNAAFF